MAEVSNPYNLNSIDKDYKGYSKIINEDEQYNVIITIGNWSNMVYGYDGVSGSITGRIGTLNKNTSGISISQLCLITIFDNRIGVNLLDTNPNTIKLKLESPQGSGISELYNNQAQTWNIPSVADYFKNNIGTQFKCNITKI